MSLYCTTTGLATLMVGVNFSANTALASACCDRAERRINSLLARRYDLSSSYFQTTTSIPPQVREWATMMASGYLWCENSRGGAGKESMARGQGLIKEVMADLTLLADYKLELVNTAGSVIADMSDTSMRVLCNTRNYTPTFDEGDELCWRPDSDKLEDIADAKD